MFNHVINLFINMHDSSCFYGPFYDAKQTVLPYMPEEVDAHSEDEACEDIPKEDKEEVALPGEVTRHVGIAKIAKCFRGLGRVFLH